MSISIPLSLSRLAAVFFVVLSVGPAPIADAQTTATLAGSVLDASGGALPGVQVTLRQPATGFTRSTVTAAEGRFVVAGLSAGVYELRAEISGFRPVSRAGIVVTVGEMVSLPPITLEVGGIQEAVTVTGAIATVNTQTSELSYLVGEQAVSSLPLNGRNYTDLALLQPGVLAYPSRGGGSVVAHGLGMSVNGQDYRSNVYLLDGTLLNDFTNGPAGSAAGTTLGVESVQEFRVESNAYSAEYGRNFGGQINVITNRARCRGSRRTPPCQRPRSSSISSRICTSAGRRLSWKRSIRMAAAKC